MPVCGFIYSACSTSRPVAMRVERPVLRWSLGWPIGQDHRAWWYAWFRRVQASKGPQTSHPSRHPWTTARQPCRTGRHIRSACVRSAAWGIECHVSENPDHNSRCRPRKPQASFTPPFGKRAQLNLPTVHDRAGYRRCWRQTGSHQD